MLDETAHLKYLQSILLKYNQVRALTKSIIPKYFWKYLKPSILAKLEHQNLELKSFNQMVKKAINAKAKVALQPCSSTQKID